VPFEPTCLAQATAGHFWKVDPVKYSGNTLSFLSDHATVFGTYRISGALVVPDWAQDANFPVPNTKILRPQSPNEMTLASLYTEIQAVRNARNIDFMNIVRPNDDSNGNDASRLVSLANHRISLGGKPFEEEEAVEFRMSIALENAELEDSIEIEDEKAVPFYRSKRDSISEDPKLNFDQEEIIEELSEEEAKKQQILEPEVEYIRYSDPTELVKDDPLPMDDPKQKPEDRRRNSLMRRLESFQKIR